MKSNKCSNCGASLSTMDYDCPYCGAELKSKEETIGHIEEEIRRKRKKTLLLCGFLFFIPLAQFYLKKWVWAAISLAILGVILLLQDVSSVSDYVTIVGAASWGINIFFIVKLAKLPRLEFAKRYMKDLDISVLE